VCDTQLWRVGHTGCVDPRHQVRVADQKPRPDLPDEPGELTRRTGRISGHRHRAQRCQREPTQQVRRRRARRHDDEVAVAHAQVSEAVSEPRDLTSGRGEGRCSVVRPQPDPVRIPLGGGEQQPRDRVGGHAAQYGPAVVRSAV
jgi:hypothetical protein